MTMDRSEARLLDPGHPRRPGRRPGHRRDGRADLRHLDLHPGGARPAQGLRVLAQRQPDADRPGDLPGGAGRRRARPGVRLGPGGDDGGAVGCSSPATRSPPRPTSTAARFACSNASSSRGAWSPATPTTPARPASRSIITPTTKLVWIETPTNPLLQILDIAAIAELAHKAGAMLAVDNTFASPYLQQPLALGADLVVHSTTKYLGGHSDVVGGAVDRPSASCCEPIAFYQNAAGGVPGPFDAWLTLRGLKTLAVRMERHCANARRLADWLAEQPQVERVYYPGPAEPSRPRRWRRGRCATSAA